MKVNIFSLNSLAVGYRAGVAWTRSCKRCKGNFIRIYCRSCRCGMAERTMRPPARVATLFHKFY